MEAAGRRGAGFPKLQRARLRGHFVPRRRQATRNLQPGCNVLVKTFLGFESRSDNDDWTMRKKVSQ